METTLPRYLPSLDPRKAITQYSLDVWQIEQGLPQNTINAIAQTTDGYLWLGTQQGLARFDGVRFTVFHRRNEPLLIPNEILSLRAGRDGGLWIGGYQGVVRYRNRAFSKTPYLDGLKHPIVNTIWEDRSGRLWIGTRGSGLVRISGDERTLFDANHLLPDNYIRSIHEDPHGAFWIGTESGLCRLTEGEGAIFGSEHGMRGKIVTGIASGSEGTLWVATSDGGLHRREGDRFTLLGEETGMADTRIRALWEGMDGSVWTGTTGSGLLRWHDGAFSSLSVSEGLSSHRIYALHGGREGDLWIGTCSGGLNRLKESKFTAYGAPEGFPRENINPIYEDRHRTTWFGSNDGAIVNMKDRAIHSFSRKDGWIGSMLFSFCEDDKGRLWIGTDEGLYQWRENEHPVFRREEGLPHANVRAILQGRDGSLIAGTYGGGIYRGRDGKWQPEEMNASLARPFIHVVLEGADGTLWAGTSGQGLVGWKNGTLTNYRLEDGLCGNNVFDLHEDDEGTLWIAVGDGGLARLQAGRLTAYSTAEGLHDDTAFRILEDDLGCFWVTSNRGIYKVRRDELNRFAEGKIARIACMPYGKGEGARSAECNGGFQPAGWKDRDGRLWFPTIRGTLMIDPLREAFNPLPPPLVIESVRINDREFDPDELAVVPPGKGSLVVQYTATSFLIPEKVRFRYRLFGFESDWVDAETRREAYYTNLPPGSYRFQVIACNNDGVWNEEGASFAFTLQPSFRQTPGFLGLLAVAGLGLGAAGIRLRERRHRERENHLQRLVEQRTRELAEANVTLQRLSTLDGLTQIPNHRRFIEVYEEEWSRAARRKEPLSILMADIDSFKLFNDHHGHQKGNECIKHVAVLLSGQLKRAGDMVARYGGEEFVILLPGTDSKGASEMAEEMRAKVEAERIEHGFSATGPFLTMSFGVATATPGISDSSDALLAQADENLYRAKRLGRNRVVLQPV